MMFGDDDETEAKRAMLEKLRNYGSERMTQGLKKKPDLSITIAAGGAKPDPSKLREEEMDDEPADEGESVLTSEQARADFMQKEMEKSRREKEAAGRRMLRPGGSGY